MYVRKGGKLWIHNLSDLNRSESIFRQLFPSDSQVIDLIVLQVASFDKNIADQSDHLPDWHSGFPQQTPENMVFVVWEKRFAVHRRF